MVADLACGAAALPGDSYCSGKGQTSDCLPYSESYAKAAGLLEQSVMFRKL